jgi:signal transduction histidine kinase
MQYFTSPLRNKILVLFLLLAVIPVLLLGGLTLYLLDITHREDVYHIEREVVEAVRERVEKFVLDVQSALELQLEAVDTGDISNNFWQQQLANAILREHDVFREIVFVTLDGREIARAARAVSGPLLDVSELPEFETARGGTFVAGELHYTQQGPHVLLAAPVFADGRVVQVILAETDMRGLIYEVANEKIGQSGYVVLLDQTNSVITVDTPALRKTQYAPRDMRYTSMITGEAVSGTSTHIPLFSWSVLAEWPLSEADAIIRDVRNQVVWIIIAAVAVVIMIAALIATRLMRPINMLEAGTREIAKGNFAHSIAISTRDELEELGNAFNKMAQGLRQLQELKNEFVFVAAHELRAPTTVIKGYISMILDGDTGAIPKETKEYLGEANKANQQLLQLVSDLLEIARSDANKIQIQVTPVAINECVESVLSEAKALTGEKNITITYHRPSEPIVAQADAKRLQEVFMNFITNAVKYNRPRGAITVSHEIKKNQVITHIADTGFGIPKGEQKNIFEKFYRTSAARKSGEQGTGLGLFITKELIERMGGTLWFVSEEGAGTTFSFSLPKRTMV